MILAHFLANDRQVRRGPDNPTLLKTSQALQRTINEWPKDIYDISAVIVAILSELDRCTPSSSKSTAALLAPASSDTVILMECLAEL